MIGKFLQAVRPIGVLLTIFATTIGSANPRVISDYILGSEAVNVDVSMDASYVKGNFEFVLIRHRWDAFKSEFNVRLFRPIVDLPIAVLPSEKSADDSLTVAAPQMYLDGKIYPGMDPDDERRFVRAKDNRLVSWRMVEFFTERAEFGRSFKTEIQYVQRNLEIEGRKLFFYLPLIPSPDEFPDFYRHAASNYRIRVRPLPGVSVRKYDDYYELKAIEDGGFEIVPESGKVLIIEVVPDK